MTSDTAITIGTLIALIGCFVGLAGWLSGRDKKIVGDAQWRGEINAKLDIITGIKSDVAKIEKVQSCHAERIAKVEAACSSAHHRIDGMEERK